ncbi:MAG: hypothetical protein ACREVI_15620 [Steroidobacteraceae bacterium]
MRHPLHVIFKHWLDSEQFAFDPQAREFWQIVPWPLHENEPGNQSMRAPRPNGGDGNRESKAPS